MASQYTPQDSFADALIYDLADRVRGSLDGDANIPIQVLADRTQYLFNRQGRIEHKRVTGTYTYDVADAGKAFSFHINANSAFNLPDVATLVPGTVIRINTRIPVIKALTINCNGSQKIFDGADDLSVMYMHDAERLWLTAAASDNGPVPDHWEIDVADGNFKTAGQSFGVRKQPRNSIVNDGCPDNVLHNRADMPRLWLAVSTMGAALVDDSVWLSDPGGKPVYRGCFSKGNNSTTFRSPDERGVADRYLDLGRGIDNTRLYNAAGGYEPDQFPQHRHFVNTNDRNATGTGNFPPIPDQNRSIAREWAYQNGAGAPGYYLTGSAPGAEPVSGPTSKTGVGSETNVKNIGKIPITLY